MDKLLNHSEENIRKSTREQLIKNEVVAYDEGRNMVPVEWWNRRHKENFKTSEQVISIIGDSYLDACVELFQKAVRN